MSWTIRFTEEAAQEMRALDGAVRPMVEKALRRVSENPTAAGYGKPLGNLSGTELWGLYKIKLVKSGIRVVYALQEIGGVMFIIVIAARADDAVYKLADVRRRAYDL